MDKDRVYRKVGQALMGLGVYPHLKGFEYIQSMVLLGLEQGFKPITDKGYAIIAQQFNTKPLNVARAIRHCTKLASEQASISAWRAFTGNSFTNRLTNTEFLSILIEDIKQDNFN